jgi:hypothetical protein
METRYAGGEAANVLTITERTIAAGTSVPANNDRAGRAFTRGVPDRLPERRGFIAPRSST